MPDVVTFGEAMLRLSPPGNGRLEDARSFDAWPAGAELNVAVGLARLGTSAAWVSRLPRSALGRLVAAHARAHGVEVDHVVWADGGRLGLYFVELGAAPRTSAALYDRAASACATLEPGDFDWPATLRGARAFHTTGITAALSDSCARAVVDALTAARALGCRTSYDLNFRGRLADPAAWSEVVERVAPLLDILVASADDADAVFGVTGQPGEVADELRSRIGIPTVVVSCRVPDGGRQRRIAALAGEDAHETTSPPFETVDPVGGGDAFCAGFLHGLLDAGPRRGLELACAAAALKQTIPGDAPVFSLAEVDRLLAGETLRMAR